MKKNIPNVITCLNLLTGSLGIYFVLQDKGIEAIYFVLIGGVFDLLDGFVARMLKVSSDVGKQLDSLADLVTFGLLPAFYLLKLLEPKTDLYWLALLIGIFSAIRLAIFNIDNSQSTNFRGLPTPANAIMLTSLTFLPFSLNQMTLFSLIVFSCILLVSNIRLIALKFNSFKWTGNEGRWLVIFGSLIFVIVFQWTFLPFLIPFYIGVSLVSGVKKNKIE